MSKKSAPKRRFIDEVNGEEYGVPVATGPILHSSAVDRGVCWSEIDARVDARQTSPESALAWTCHQPASNGGFLHFPSTSTACADSAAEMHFWLHCYRNPSTKAVLRRDEQGWVLYDRCRVGKFPGERSDRNLELTRVQASMLPGELKDARYLRFEDGELSSMF